MNPVRRFSAIKRVTPVSIAIARFTYRVDDVGRLRGGWVVRYPVIGVASTLGFLASRASERVAKRGDGGLTLIAEAVKSTTLEEIR